MQQLISNREKIIALSIIVCIVMAGLLGIDIHLASMPHIMKAMHTTKTIIQHSISYYLLGMGLSLLIAGPLSDNLGRRKIVIFGLSACCLASIAAVFTHNIHIFLLMRLLQGIGAGTSCGLGRTMAVDVMSTNKNLLAAQGYLSAVIGLSPLLGPVIGGYLQSWCGWQANFVFLGVLFLILLIVYVVFCPETNRFPKKGSVVNRTLLTSYYSLFTHRVFICATVLSGLAMAGNITYAALSPFIFQVSYHLSPVIYGWITTGVAIGIVLGRMSNAKFIPRFGSIGTMQIGIVLLFTSSLWLLALNLTGLLNIPLILCGVFLTLYGQAFITTNSMLIALKPHHDKRGLAGSLFGSFQMIVTCLVTLVVSGFTQGGVLLLGGVYFGLSIIGMLLLYTIRNRETQHSTDSPQYN